MNFSEALDVLKQIGPELPPQQRDAQAAAAGLPPRRFSLDAMQTLLTALSEPQKMVPAVLVAGTNGKGSTSATLAAIGAAAGLRTGLYTSPHLSQITERIRLSDNAEKLAPISDERFAELFTRVHRTAERLLATGELTTTPSFFERLTAMAFLCFADARVELAVLEVGLGGRLDATNTADPVASVITDVAMDHMEYLGDTITQIAAEKAGILRPHGVLVTLSQHPEANAAIGEAAVRLGVRGVDASRFLPPRGFAPPADADGLPGRNAYTVPFDDADGTAHVLQLDSPLAGSHQQRNVALAVATAIELRTNHLAKHPAFARLTDAAIERGVASTEWPARLEVVRLPGSAPMLLDVAHNPAGAWALRAAISQLNEARPRTLLFSCLADKPVDELARVLFPLFDAAGSDPARRGDHVVLAPIDNPRAATMQQLLAAAHHVDVPAHAAPHLHAAVEQARQVTPAGGIIVVTGSVYLVGAVRSLVAQHEPPTHGAEVFRNVAEVSRDSAADGGDRA